MFKKKWYLYWLGFIILFSAGIGFAFFFNQSKWFPQFIQIYGISIPILFGLIIYLQSNESQRIDSNNKLKTLENNTKKQIAEQQKLVEKQIKAIQENTDRQIQNYINQTQNLVEELKNNSVLLAEILNRQLEDAIIKTNEEIEILEGNYQDANRWKFLRTQDEKDEELSRIEEINDWLQRKKDYFMEKFNIIQNFLGQKKLGE